MYLHIAEGHNIDFDSLELVYIYIESYNVFQKTGFCLHPAYKIQEINKDINNLNISIKKKQKFVDLFKKEQVNVKIICGKNGVGKTTLLSLLERANLQQCVYLFKDRNDNFAASRKIEIAYNKENSLLNQVKTYQEIRMCYACPTHKNIQIPAFSLKRDIVDFYKNFPDLFENILSQKDPLITHFTVKLAPDSVDEIIALAQNFIEDDYLDSIRENPSLFYIISCLCDSSFESIRRDLKKSKKPFLETLQDILQNKLLYKRIKILCDSLFKNEYPLELYDSVNQQISTLSNKLSLLIRRTFGDQVSILYDFRHFIYLKGFSQKNGSIRFIDDLSEGEFIKLKYSHDLVNSVAQSTRIFLPYDEPDRGLHPEWCRSFLKDFFSVYSKIIKYEKKRLDNFNPRKRMSFFFATHSPFLLSDVTNDYVIYLEKNSNGLSKEVQKKKNTFAGNIGEMFSTNFFMDRTIGAFATNWLKKKIFVKTLNNDDKKEMRLLLNYVGDDLLKQLLIEKWDLYEKN